MAYDDLIQGVEQLRKPLREGKIEGQRIAPHWEGHATASVAHEFQYGKKRAQGGSTDAIEQQAQAVTAGGQR